MLNRLIRRDEQGAGAVEFALALPALITFIIGTTQLGALFFADADLRHAVAAGARVASVWPVPEDETIIAKIEEKIVHLDDASTSDPAITRGTDANGNAWLEITMTHAIPLDFVFFRVGPVTLSETRRVFIQTGNALQQGGAEEDEGEEEEEEEGGSGTSNGGTSSDGGTSNGGTSSDGGTSNGGTSSDGTTSNGGTSSDGTTSNGGTSSDGTTPPPSSTGNSNGNSNGGSNSNGGHNHGDCKNNC